MPHAGPCNDSQQAKPSLLSFLIHYCLRADLRPCVTAKCADPTRRMLTVADLTTEERSYCQTLLFGPHCCCSPVHHWLQNRCTVSWKSHFEGIPGFPFVFCCCMFPMRGKTPAKHFLLKEGRPSLTAVSYVPAWRSPVLLRKESIYA